MIIDWQHHFLPKEIATRSGTESGHPAYDKDGNVETHVRLEVHQIDKHLEFMNVAGIDIAVLSAPGCRSLEDCKLANDAMGDVIRSDPDRFVGLASCLPTRGSEGLKELDRAINELGLKGVCIDAQIEGHELDSDIVWPFYEMVSKLNVPVFVHIAGTRVGYDAFRTKYNLWVTLGTMVLDMSATVRIILGGVLSSFPDIDFVISHMGGGISAILERFVRYVDSWGNGFWSELGGTPPFDKPYGENFLKQFNKLYFDLAGYEGGMNAVKCALTTIRPERLLFGTDYPPNFTDNPQAARGYIDNLRKLDLPSASIELMLGGNAAELINLK